ncbi:hypothetical protein GCM10022384_03030 [Streptomyces marokkonensis]|uniref:Uncharacterized protein n=1 Tax=Streptomyces marokkonensis TaxID=324855 RepID=A0ABP7NS15_9ACTN
MRQAWWGEFERSAPGWSVYRSGKRTQGTAPKAPPLIRVKDTTTEAVRTTPPGLSPRVDPENATV